MEIGEQLGQLRAKKELSLRQLEEVSGVGYAHIKRIESGANASIDTITKIANALGYRITLEKLKK